MHWGWEGNRRFSNALAMCYRLHSSNDLWAQGHEHPAYVPVVVRPFLFSSMSISKIDIKTGKRDRTDYVIIQELLGNMCWFNMWHKLLQTRRQSVRKTMIVIFQQHSLLMKVFAWNEASQCLIILSVTISLPPVRVILIDYMQDVTLPEQNAKFSTRN